MKVRYNNEIHEVVSIEEVESDKVMMTIDNGEVIDVTCTDKVKVIVDDYENLEDDGIENESEHELKLYSDIKFDFANGKVECRARIYGDGGSTPATYWQPSETWFTCEGVDCDGAVWYDNETGIELDVEVTDEVEKELCQDMSYIY